MSILNLGKKTVGVNFGDLGSQVVIYEHNHEIGKS